MDYAEAIDKGGVYSPATGLMSYVEDGKWQTKSATNVPDSVTNGSTGPANESLAALQGQSFATNTPGVSAKPDLKELMDATGVDFSTASDLLYGSVGSNTDTRNWNAILSGATSGAEIIARTRAATNAMHGGVTVKDVNGSLMLVGGNGTVLRGAGTGPTQISHNLSTYGVSDSSWVNGVTTSYNQTIQTANEAQTVYQGIIADPASTPKERAQAQEDLTRSKRLVTQTQERQVKLDELTSMGEAFIAPFKRFSEQYDFDASSFITGLSESTLKPKSAEEEDAALGVVEQTIQAPQAVTPGTTNVAVPGAGYQEAPQAAAAVPVVTPAAVPVTQTPYTPTPTTITGQPVTTGVTGTGVYPQAPVTGSMAAPLQTAGTSALPTSVQVRPNYTGTTTANLTSQSQKGFGGQRTYANQFGQQLTVTVDASGNPLTYVPPGYTPVQGQAQGGVIKGYAEGGMPKDPMLEAKFRIASMNGYNGPKTNADLNAFASASPNMRAKFNAIGVAMSQGGSVRRGFDEGGLTKEQLDAMQRSAVSQTMQPIQAPVAQITPEAADFIAPTAGQTTAVAPMAEAMQVGTVQQAQMPMMTAASQADFTPAYQQIQAETADLTAAQGQVAPEAQVQAAQQLTTSVTGMEAAQGTATMVNSPAAREIQAGELISGVADAEKAALFNEQIQAATATPSKQATVAGQLEGLMQQFEGGETPAWAAGSMRNAMATLSARGLGASSMAGQAVIQAAMEAALPIAQMDAQVQAQFEGQNLSNRQQRAMLAAQQRATFLGMEFDQDFQSRVQNSARIGDIANMNFTAEQNIALENSRAANTMNLSNLNNRQAMVMAEAAALSQLDTQNLNNRQQAAVQNAQNFMQMDMTNLANEQQTAMFKSLQNIQALFTDQAAENAGKQFNASSQNQTNQFFANLSSQTSQFNASQQNAMDQFNVNSVNALREFNSEIQQQRDLFNAQNGLVIAQSNAQWRQNLSTLNTAAQNQSNSDFAKTMNALTASNMDQIWQRERDLMSFAFAASESASDRASNIAIAKLTAAEQSALQDNIGKGKLTAIATQAILGKWLG